MLGQLLNWTPSRRSHPLSRGGSHDSQHALDSVTEDAHTLALLFPAPASLHHSARDYAIPLHDSFPSSSNGFDELGPDAGAPQDSDVRVLVAQDESDHLPKSILFDSKPPQTAPSPSSERPPSSFNFFREKLPPNSSSSFASSSPSSSHSRRYSQSQSTTTSQESRRSGSSVTSTSSFFRQATDPTRPGFQSQRGHSRGHSSSSSATGLPSLRRLAKDADDELHSCLECMFGSATLKYRGMSTKVHILQKDQTSNPWDRATASSSTFTVQAVARPSTAMRPSLQRIPSRLNSFSDEKTSRKILITRMFAIQPRSNEQQLSQGGSSASSATRQSPIASRQGKLPLYSVSLLIRIPSPPSRKRQPKSPTSSEFLSSWSSSLVSDTARSSRGSDSMLESTIFDTNFGSLSSLADALDDEEGMSSITRHWVVIGRVLDQLQHAVESQVVGLREGAGHQLRRTGSLPLSLNSTRVVRGEQSGHAEPVMLQPGALSGNEAMEAAAESATARLGQSFSTRPAVSGQERWAVWKEEARWVDRWARTSEQSTLFVDLLSSFLSIHTEWMEAIDSTNAKQHRSSKSKTNGQMAARTVIVSNNKMKARRFIFLLASFLPRTRDGPGANDGTPYGSERGDGLASPGRPPTTSRFDLRQEQTAPAASRRSSRDQGRRYSSKQLSNLSAAIEMSKENSLTRSRTNTSIQSGSPGRDPLPLNATTDVTSAMPVAHFTSGGPEIKNRRGSAASARLWDNLQLLPPQPVASQPASPQAESSTRGSADLQRDPLGVFGSAPTGSGISKESTLTGEISGSKLEQMVNELSIHGRTTGSPTRDPMKLSTEPGQETSISGTAPRDIPTPRQKPSDPPSMPFSLSINEKDGFVDVEIPLDSYGASLQSLSSRAASDRGNGSVASGAMSLPSRLPSSDVAVGGYLQSFNQELTLQAVRPYHGLENDMRAALHAQASKGAATILVANIDTSDIQTLTLRSRRASVVKADEPAPRMQEAVRLERVTPDATDTSLARAVTRMLRPSESTSQMSSRAGSSRMRGGAAATLGTSPSSLAGSSAGTSVRGTPPGSASEILRERERERERNGRVVYEALDAIARDVLQGEAGGPSGGESALRRSIREHVAATAARG